MILLILFIRHTSEGWYPDLVNTKVVSTNNHSWMSPWLDSRLRGNDGLFSRI